MAWKNQPEDPVMSEINMTPLVDVMLVLLIIFMLTVPLLTQRIKLNLPQAQGITDPQKTESITLLVDAQGKVYWNDQPVSQAALQERLRLLGQRRPQAELRLKADQRTTYQDIMSVLSAAQQRGLSRISFITTAPGQTSAPSH